MSRLNPKPDTRYPLLPVLLVCFSLANCATLEFSHRPEAPEVRSLPRSTQEDHPSPPPLENAQAGPVSPQPSETAPEPLKLTVEAAIDMTLENNQALKVQKVDPASARTLIAEQRAAFDPTVAASLGYTRDRIEHDLDIATTVTGTSTRTGIGATQNSTLQTSTRAEKGATTSTTSGTVGISEYLPTGTSVNVSLTPLWTRIDNFSSEAALEVGSDTHGRETVAELSLKQHLLQGSRLKVNLASMRQARLAAFATDYGLRAYVENLVAQVESNYWDYCLALRQIKILEDSLKVAEDQATEIAERIRVGTVAESERAASEAEVAQRKTALIEGRGALAQLRLGLLRLLNPSENALRDQEVTLVSEPVVPEVPLDKIEEAIAFARRMRPEMNPA